MPALLRALLLCSLLLAVPLAGHAGIYKYRDANGRLNFVDDESRVPAEFRDNVTSMAEAEDSLVVYDTLDNDKEAVAEAHAEQKNSDSRALKKLLEKHQTPVVIKGNRVLVPVEVAMGNRVAKLSLLLDTGATSTVLHRESLSELHLPSGKMYKARVAGGGIVNSEKIRFSHIRVGPFKVS